MNKPRFILFIISCALGSAAENELVVKVKNGMLRGKYLETRNGRKIMGFMGIPYAKPPVGNLRFQPPVPADVWDGIKDATNNKHNICYQHGAFSMFEIESVNMSEDCLLLNVYTPQIDKSNLLPVMVWIHGGAFHSGFANDHMYGPGFLLDRDILFVAMNYRLGILGFLTTGDTVIPGNMGLKDQSFALRWVKENIINFGGDPNSITIFGGSSGASNTHLQMLAPQNKGLFHGAICQSGNGVAYWALMSLSRGLELTKKLASLLNCDTENSKTIIDCMMKIDASEINDKQKHFSEWNAEPVIIFGPVIEPEHPTAFISNTPEYILKNKLGSDVPWLTGVTSEEGVMKVSILLTNGLLQDLSDNFFDIAHLFFNWKRNRHTNEAVKRIKKFYFGDAEISYDKEKELIDLYSDAAFVHSLHKAVTLHKKYSSQPIYNYLFAYRGNVSLSTMFSGSNKYYGVCHGDELLYLYPILNSFMPGVDIPAENNKMSDTLVTLWTNFATYGNPTPEGSKTIWKPVETRSNEYLLINGPENLVMEKDMFKERIDFWDSVDPLLERDDVKDEL